MGGKTRRIDKCGREEERKRHGSTTGHGGRRGANNLCRGPRRTRRRRRGKRQRGCGGQGALRCQGQAGGGGRRRRLRPSLLVGQHLAALLGAVHKLPLNVLPVPVVASDCLQGRGAEVNIAAALAGGALCGAGAGQGGAGGVSGGGQGALTTQPRQRWRGKPAGRSPAPPIGAGAACRARAQAAAPRAHRCRRRRHSSSKRASDWLYRHSPSTTMAMIQSPGASFSVPRARMHLPQSRSRSKTWEGRAQ